MQQLLLAAFGDLQAVWTDTELQALLLRMPLQAMQLLLSSDQLTVPSEDTVLYAAEQYVQAQSDTAAAATARAALAQLVRVPQLSQFALRCSALPADRDQQLLGSYGPQLRSLCSLRSIATAEELDAELQMGKIEGASASWQLGPRQMRGLEDGVLLHWRLQVEDLQKACRESFAEQKAVFLDSPNSPPFGGVAWQMSVECYQRDGGTVMGVDVAPVGLPPEAWMKFKFSITWLGVSQQLTACSPCIAPGHPCGVSLHIQPMAGGWDEQFWADAGIPAEGETVLELRVHSVV